jgi:poly(A) polymerase
VTAGHGFAERDRWSRLDMPTPEAQRRFAEEVVRRLRGAGFEAYWAGGCVRDQLLRRVPKDYDVATNAVPDQVRTLFGRRRTLAIGAAFGVIAVIGPKAAGAVEVTTFRRDAPYSDGRHPDSVAFSSAEEDASRRDFTINGLFYDPMQERVLDFVGGQKDLAEKRLRAIGDARLRFAEDKLRMLRAVRFAATFAFALDGEARAAIAEMAAQIHVVSPERIAMEMRRLLADRSRADGVRMMVETKLAAEVLPEIVPQDDAGRQRLDDTLATLTRLGEECGFPLALATLLYPFADAVAVAGVCQRWRLSNKETERVGWLVENHAALEGAPTMRWSQLQPLLVAEGMDDLVTLTEAASPTNAEAAAYCRSLVGKPRETLDPLPLLTGNDLLAQGIPSGPEYKTLLQRTRAAQLDGEIHSRAEALALVEKWRGEGRGEREKRESER